jgi:4-amino-4-deoxy-L-arabinose transferase-like glycosyltransferase
MKRTAWIVLAIVAAGVLLRSLRLSWQPIWWDEGYSVYFATESLSRLLWLTARDIHPPLYYALLHLWLGMPGGPSPENGRILSILFGGLALPLQYRLARAMFPARRLIAWIALLLLTFSPIHLYYSQEIRMYGLALTLGLAASIALWRWVAGRRQWGWALAYLLTGLAALYTLYYAALLLFAHAVWALVRLRKNLRAFSVLGGVYLLMFLLYLPWLTYAVPQLVGYVGGKVQSDQDTPLGPLAYLERHLVAYTAGQVRLAAVPTEWMALAPATIAICAIILGLVLAQTLRPQALAGAAADDERGLQAKTRGREAPARVGVKVRVTQSGEANAALWTWLIVPVMLGWLINLRLPFFPAGGERLLLVALPYLLLLLAYGIDRTWKVVHMGKVAAAALAINATIGIAAFYTTPRYAADDYRPLIRQMVQQGDNQATFLAIFPWQVGYWRAYTPFDDAVWPPPGPNPLLMSDGAVDWSPTVAAQIDKALQGGTVWFPEPLTFGSSLPDKIEQYLGDSAINLENRWYGATRLTAWDRLPTPVPEPQNADFGHVRLLGSGIGPTTVASANVPVAATLVWLGNEAGEANVSLRLQDREGHVWSSREYERTLPAAGETITETVGLLVPVGLPPGDYQVAVSVQTDDGQPLTITGSDAVAAVIGDLEVSPPDEGGPAGKPGAERLPIQHALERPAEYENVKLLGYTGPDEDMALLAGTELGVTLFFANQGEAAEQTEIYLSLLDEQGRGVAGYEGWPLGNYPTALWPEDALVQVPVAFSLPGALTSDKYRLVAGFRNPETGEKTAPVDLATITIVRRPASFERPAPTHAFAAPPQLGTHARLLGYDLAAAGVGPTNVRLYWEVLQPLLPPHHIFVHLDTPEGHTIGQQDGPPIAAGPTTDPRSGPAPSGSWQPGEFLTTEHTLDSTAGSGDVVRIGLYDPDTQVRLPVTVNGQPAGDNVVLQPDR